MLLKCSENHASQLPIHSKYDNYTSVCPPIDHIIQDRYQASNYNLRPGRLREVQDKDHKKLVEFNVTQVKVVKVYVAKSVYFVNVKDVKVTKVEVKDCNFLINL